jgi:hypothetical protein
VNLKKVQSYLDTHCYTLDKISISFIDQYDLGPINNTIKKLTPHTLGIMRHIESSDEYYIFYINSEDKLTGFICNLNFLDPLRNDVTYAFCGMINRDFPNHTRFFRIFNNYQTQTITIAEKLGYVTYQDEFEEISLSGKYLHIPLIDQVQQLKQLYAQDKFTIDSNGDNYIYLIYNVRTDLTKIGRSKNPIAREKTLQSEDPKLNIVALWKGDKAVEKILQLMFHSKRKRGEWFDLDSSDFIKIKTFMDDRI